MSDFDIDGARKAGYSDTEIADHLGQSRGFDVKGARAAGYSDSDIIGHLKAAPDQTAAPTAAPVSKPPVQASAVYQGRPMSIATPEPTPVAPPAEAAPSANPLSSVPGQMIRNAPESARNFLHALVQPIVHPADTANALTDTVLGATSKAVTPLREGVQKAFGYGPEAPDPEMLRKEAVAKGVGDYFAERYGSWEGFKKALATDPVAVMADLSVVLGGSGAALRAPGIAGKVGDVVSAAGRAVDPVNIAAQGVKLAGKGADALTSNALGMTTGAGAESIRAAARAGKEGGDTAKAFRENMRGQVPIEDVVNTAKAAVEDLRAQRADAYKKSMGEVGKDKTVLDFQPIDDALAKSQQVGTYKGVTVNRSAGEAMDKAAALVNEWKNLDPKEFHTPEGLDALKRTLGDLRDSTEAGSPARVAVDRLYRAVKGEIDSQAPTYAKTMEAYGKASDQLKEVTKTFSLGEKATGDTASRKLLSATRNNVQTNYGQRQKLLDVLAQSEPTLPYMIAGQGLNALAPRGLVGRGGAMVTGSSLIANPANALALPAFSPRVVGETAYLGGKGVGAVENALNAMGVTAERLRRANQAAFQAGRLQEAR